ncbi:MAG: hypothetical protein ACP5D2_01790 [Candidatus Nanoarchaeia archaeon]
MNNYNICPLARQCDGARQEDIFKNICNDNYRLCTHYHEGKPTKFEKEQRTR